MSQRNRDCKNSPKKQGNHVGCLDLDDYDKAATFEGQARAPMFTTNTETRDYSRFSPPSPQTNAFLKQQTPTFPVILHSMISDPALNHIISWLSHGRAWRIIQPHAFKNEIVPRYFQHGRFSSVARQISGWGFQRISSGVDTGAYCHPKFLRGKRYLCYQMKRLKSKPKGVKSLVSVGNHQPPPNFYAMEKENPLPLIDDWDNATSLLHCPPTVPAPPALSVSMPRIDFASSNIFNGLAQGTTSSSLSSNTSLDDATTVSPQGCSSLSYQGNVDAQIKVLELLMTALSARLLELNEKKEREEIKKAQDWKQRPSNQTALAPGLSTLLELSLGRRVDMNELVLRMILQNAWHQGQGQSASDLHSSQTQVLKLQKPISTGPGANAGNVNLRNAEMIVSLFQLLKQKCE